MASRAQQLADILNDRRPCSLAQTPGEFAVAVAQMAEKGDKDAQEYLLESAGSTPRGFTPVDEGTATGSATETSASDSIVVLTARAEQAEADRDRLLADWRAQDAILQQIAALVGDEHVTDATGVLTAVQAYAAELDLATDAVKALNDARMENLDRADAAEADAEALRQALQRITARTKAIRDHVLKQRQSNKYNTDDYDARWQFSRLIDEMEAALLACEGRGRPQLEHDEEKTLTRSGELGVLPSPQPASTDWKG